MAAARRDSSSAVSVSPSGNHIVFAERTSTGPSLLARACYFVCALVYLAYAVAVFQLLHDKSRERGAQKKELVILIVVFLVHCVDCIMNAVVDAETWWRINEVIQLFFVPLLILIPFDFAARIEIDNGFFQIRERVVWVTIGLISTSALVSTLCTNTRNKTRDTAFRLSFVGEVIVNFLCLGLGMLLWTQRHYMVLMLGAICATITLVFHAAGVLTDVGRLVFFGTVIFTEEWVRRYHLSWGRQWGGHV